jgi:hypothetical protein
MKVVDAETRDRHAYIEKAQTELLETLQLPDIQYALAPTEGIIEKLQDILSGLQICNVRNQTVDLPRSQIGTDRTPCVAMRSNEVLTLGKSVRSFAPIQREQVTKWVQTQTGDQSVTSSYVGNIDRLLRVEDKPFRMRAEIDGLTITSTIGEAIPGPSADAKKTWVFFGHPVVAFNIDSTTPGLLILIHELVHVDQLEREPYNFGDEARRIEANASLELEAYDVSSCFGNKLFLIPDTPYEGNPELLEHTYVNQLRVRFADPERPHFVNEKLKRAVARAGFASNLFYA